MKLLRVFVMFLFWKQLQGIKYFTFEPYTNGTLSYATLQGPPNSKLPDSFVLCTSHLETSIDGSSFITVVGDDGQPWLSLSIWSDRGYPVLWLKKWKIWFEIMNIEEFWLNFWIHICMKVNNESGDIVIYVNGESPISTNVVDLRIQKPDIITGKLLLGLSDQGRPGDPKQFVGSVTNVKLFEDNGTTNIQKITKDLCVQHGEIVTANSTWFKQGPVKESTADIWEVCYEQLTYRVAIPVPTDFIEGLEICTKLGSGNMVELKNVEDMEHTLALFENQNSSCEYIWTPLTDEEVEGQFKNIETGTLASYLPWQSWSPSGLEKQNNVILDLASKLYEDQPGIVHNTCNACDLSVSTTFSLNGVCKDTYMSKNIHFSSSI